MILYLVTLAIILSNYNSHEMLSKQISDMNHRRCDLYIKSTDDVLFAFQSNVQCKKCYF